MHRNWQTIRVKGAWNYILSCLNHANRYAKASGYSVFQCIRLLYFKILTIVDKESTVVLLGCLVFNLKTAYFYLNIHLTFW